MQALDPPPPLPTHIDFTTVYAAALALDENVRRKEGLPLSRLLALSQLIESIVLHESLQYELGNTPDWSPYRAELEKSIISRLPTEFGVPLLPAVEQIDADESSVLSAIKRAAVAVNDMRLDLLYWAVQLRSGTYSAIPRIKDVDNPTLKRYMELAYSVDDPALQTSLRGCLSLLNDNEIGPLGLQVLVRMLLHEAFWVDGGRANYYPHFSRQPLVASLGRTHAPIEKWTMERLLETREKIIQEAAPEQPADMLSHSLSPIFIACLARSKRPEDLVDEANELRNSDAAIEYRKERDVVLASYRGGDSGLLMHYRVRLSERLTNIRDLLFERGSDVAVERQSAFRLIPGVSFGWTRAVKKVRRIDRFCGDRAVTFLGDVVLQSLALLRSADKIREVFKTSATYDTRILSIGE